MLQASEFRQVTVQAHPTCHGGVVLEPELTFFTHPRRDEKGVDEQRKPTSSTKAPES